MAPFINQRGQVVQSAPFWYSLQQGLVSLYLAVVLFLTTLFRVSHVHLCGRVRVALTWQLWSDSPPPIIVCLLRLPSALPPVKLPSIRVPALVEALVEVCVVGVCKMSADQVRYLIPSALPFDIDADLVIAR